MIQYPRKIVNFNAFVDGISYAGRATEATLPDVKIMVANHRGAGMDGPAPVDMGTEAMTADLTLADWPPELISMMGTRQTFVLRPAAKGQDDFAADTYIATVGGLITAPGLAALKPGDDVPMKLAMAADLFKLERNGEVLLHIDHRNAIRNIGGTDQLAGIRAAMGF